MTIVRFDVGPLADVRLIADRGKRTRDGRLTLADERSPRRRLTYCPVSSTSNATPARSRLLLSPIGRPVASGALASTARCRLSLGRGTRRLAIRRDDSAPDPQYRHSPTACTATSAMPGDPAAGRRTLPAAVARLEAAFALRSSRRRIPVSAGIGPRRSAPSSPDLGWAVEPGSQRAFALLTSILRGPGR